MVLTFGVGWFLGRGSLSPEKGQESGPAASSAERPVPGASSSERSVAHVTKAVNDLLARPTGSAPQEVARLGGPPDYAQQNRDRLIRAAEKLAERRAAVTK